MMDKATINRLQKRLNFKRWEANKLLKENSKLHARYTAEVALTCSLEQLPCTAANLLHSVQAEQTGAQPWCSSLN
jgi:predicted metal-dependent hydrolase